MDKGYVLISTKVGKEGVVGNALYKELGDTGITEITPIYGEHDFILKLELEDGELGKYVTTKIRTIDYITNSKTLPIVTNANMKGRINKSDSKKDKSLNILSKLGIEKHL